MSASVPALLGTWSSTSVAPKSVSFATRPCPLVSVHNCADTGPVQAPTPMPPRSIVPNDTGPDTDPAARWCFLTAESDAAVSLPMSPQPAKQIAPRIIPNFAVDQPCLVITASVVPEPAP